MSVLSRNNNTNLDVFSDQKRKKGREKTPFWDLSRQIRRKASLDSASEEVVTKQKTN